MVGTWKISAAAENKVDTCCDRCNEHWLREKGFGMLPRPAGGYRLLQAHAVPANE
jgi:hypothetical protein